MSALSSRLKRLIRWRIFLPPTRAGKCISSPIVKICRNQQMLQTPPNLPKTISEWERSVSGQKVGNMGACARIISHTGASNGDAVTTSHMTTERTSAKTKHETVGWGQGIGMYQQVECLLWQQWFLEKYDLTLIVMCWGPSSLPLKQPKNHPKDPTWEMEEKRGKNYCWGKIQGNGGKCKK